MRVLHVFLSFGLSVSAIFVTWLLLATIFTGLGLLLLRLALRGTGPFALSTDRVLSSFWLGFAGVIAVLQLWHFAFAVTWRSFAFIVFLAIIGLWSCSPDLSKWWRELRWSKANTVSAVLLVFVGIWMADWAAGRCVLFDSAMYHIQVVRWAVTYPLIPGLGNLHDRLAFNNAGLLYAAMIGIGPWLAKSNHLANGLLVFMLMIQAIVAAVRLIRAPVSFPAHCLFDLLLAFPAITIVVSGNLSSLSTDVAPALVLFVAGSMLYKWLIEPHGDVLEQAHRVAIIIPLLCLAVCLKATTVVFSAVAFAVLIWLILERSRSMITNLALWLSGATLVLLAVPWMIRGVILSGYPLYPSRIGGVPVEWRVPAEQAKWQNAWVTACARRTLESGIAWVRPWLWAMLQRQDLFLFLLWVVLPAALALGVSVAYFVVIRRNLSEWRRGLRGWVLALPILAGIVFWFVRLPDPRFGFYLFWMAAALALAPLTLVLPQQARSRYWPALAALCILLASIPVLVQAPTGWLEPKRGLFKDLVYSAVVLPPRGGGLHSLPSPKLYQFTTDSGLKVYVPVNDYRCWDAPLPCAPHPARNLVAKTRWGRWEFLTQGEWERVNFPDPRIPQ